MNYKITDQNSCFLGKGKRMILQYRDFFSLKPKKNVENSFLFCGKGGGMGVQFFLFLSCRKNKKKKKECFWCKLFPHRVWGYERIRWNHAAG